MYKAMPENPEKGKKNAQSRGILKMHARGLLKSDCSLVGFYNPVAVLWSFENRMHARGLLKSQRKAWSFRKPWAFETAGSPWPFTILWAFEISAESVEF